MKVKYFIIILFIILNINNVYAWEGLCSRVIDGDTIVISGKNNRTKDITVRLYGIDAPELKQSYGEVSKNNLIKLIYKKIVNIEEKSIDKYNRVIAIVYYDKLSINEEMLQQGVVHYYLQYCKCTKRNILCCKYSNIENETRQKKLGIWSQDTIIYPWDYRNKK